MRPLRRLRPRKGAMAKTERRCRRSRTRRRARSMIRQSATVASWTASLHSAAAPAHSPDLAAQTGSDVEGDRRHPHQASRHPSLSRSCTTSGCATQIPPSPSAPRTASCPAANPAGHTRMMATTRTSARQCPDIRVRGELAGSSGQSGAARLIGQAAAARGVGAAAGKRRQLKKARREMVP